MLANLSDVQAALRALGRADVAETLTDVDDLLQEAEDLLTGYLWPNPVPTPTPGAITRVVAAMAAAVLIKPKELLPETQTLQADGFGVTFTPGTSSLGCYLTAALKQKLRPYKAGMSSIAQGSERF